jgi:hypothetical protein
VLKDLVFLAIPLAATVLAGVVVLAGRSAGFSTGVATGGVDVVTALATSCVLIFAVLYGLKHHPKRIANILVLTFTLVGTISGLVLLKILFEASGVFPALFLAAIPMGYLGVRWSFLAYLGSLSRRRTSFLLIASSTLLGALIGASFPAAFTIVFLAGLAIMDFLVVETDLLTRLIGPRNYDNVTSVTTLPLETSFVGIGDFLAYSMLVAMSLQLIGIYGAIETIGLILLGALATLHITRRRSKTAGLLIPVGLGLIPVILAL